MLDKQDGWAAISPHADRLMGCWGRAFHSFEISRQASPIEAAKFSSRTRSGQINDLVKHEIEKEFRGNPGIRVILKYGRIVMDFNGITLRFKKLDRRLRSSYSRTQASIQFFERQMPLEEMPEDNTNIVSGYRLDEFGQPWFFYTCPIMGKNEWVIEASLTDEGDGNTTIEVQPITGPVAPVVTPKKTDLPKEETGEV